MKTLFIESSSTPIYQRIALALGRQLAQQGFAVSLVHPGAFNADSYIAFLRSQNEAIYLSNAGSNIFQQKMPDASQYYFEHFSGSMVFLHQDSLLGGLSATDAILKLLAWRRVRERSAHLTIENSSCQDLQSLGFAAVQQVMHASDFAQTAPLEDDFLHPCSFVGHVLPGALLNVRQDVSAAPMVGKALALRQADMGCVLEPLLTRHAASALAGLCLDSELPLHTIAHREWLRDQVTGESMAFRGWLFENCALPDLHIYGGDPAYLHKVDRALCLLADRATTHPAVYAEHELRSIYRGSRVSINVTSLQFDHAVINRFHDVTMAGGLCLTDYRSGLPELSEDFHSVCYRSPAELADKARFYANPANIAVRNRLVLRLQAAILARSSYRHLGEVVQAFAQAGALQT